MRYEEHGGKVANVAGEPVRQLNRRELDERMRALGLTEKAVAAAIGTDKSTVSRWRTREACRTRNEAAVQKLATLLQVDIEKLAPLVSGSLHGRFRHESGTSTAALKHARNLEQEIRRVIDEDMSVVPPATRDRLWRLVIRRVDLTK